MRNTGSNLLVCSFVSGLLQGYNCTPFLTRLFASQKSTLPPGEGISYLPLAIPKKELYNKTKNT
jgi:hypothetical protein